MILKLVTKGLEELPFDLFSFTLSATSDLQKILIILFFPRNFLFQGDRLLSTRIFHRL